MGVALKGAARANCIGEASSPSSSTALPAVPCGFANAGDPPRPRFLNKTCTGAPSWPPESAAHNLEAWTTDGGAVRALLVILVGSVALLPLTALLIFTFFLVAAATIAIVVSIGISLVAAGGFLAATFAFLAAMYVGALSVVVFVLSVTTMATVIAITIATGWVPFFWILWFSAKKCLGTF